MINKIFFEKQIILGVCGGIAAYKSVNLLRLLVRLGANVKVIMTSNATKFIGPTTFQTLSSNKVFIDLFKNEESKGVSHINLASNADFIIIAPATANIIAKIANGIADDAISTFMLAATCPVLICPSMNSNMYEHPATLRNLDRISKFGHLVLTCNSGELACGVQGTGRFPEPHEIIDIITRYLTPNDFKNKKILITAGPTREFIDPVRFISNPSSGKMGYAIASAAENRGASVTLISGPVNIKTPRNIESIFVDSAQDMAQVIFKKFTNFNIIIKVAAVSDYKSKNFNTEKIKKGQKEIYIVLKKNQDILKKLGEIKTKKQILVGFSAESSNLILNAKKKLRKKKLDMIVANLIGTPESGFETNNNCISLIFPNNRVEKIKPASKDYLAHIILNRIYEIAKNKKIRN